MMTLFDDSEFVADDWFWSQTDMPEMLPAEVLVWDDDVQDDE